MGACQLSHTAKQTVRMNVGICQLSHTAKQTVQTQNIFIHNLKLNVLILDQTGTVGCSGHFRCKFSRGSSGYLQHRGITLYHESIPISVGSSFIGFKHHNGNEKKRKKKGK